MEKQAYIYKAIAGYIAAICFTECHCDNPELEDKDSDDFSLELQETIKFDVSNFVNTNWKMLHDVPANQCGIDFWLSRNGHGAGFFDRDFEYADQLQDICRELGECCIYLGDDGLITC